MTILAEVAFHTLKQALISIPDLCMLDFSKPFVIECNASGCGPGSVLMHKKQPITYFSKNLSGQLLKMSVYEREWMALVLAVQHWEPYLYSSPYQSMYFAKVHIGSVLPSLYQSMQFKTAACPF